MDVQAFQDAILQISNSSMAALDELWTVSDSSGDSVSLLDTIADENAPDPAAALDQSDLRDRVADSISRLPEREKLVIALYYYENLTLREIGEVLGVTESRVSQLHTKAVLRLRSGLDGRSRRLSRQLRRAPVGSGYGTPHGKERRHAPGGPHSERRPRRPPRQWQDVPARGPAVSGRRHEPARVDHGRLDRLRLRSGRAGASDDDQREPQLVRLGRSQDQPDRHARRAELHRRRARRDARVRVGRLRRQRRDGRRGRHRAPVGARRTSSTSRG